MSRTTLSHVYTKIFMVMLRYVRAIKTTFLFIIVVLQHWAKIILG